MCSSKPKIPKNSTPPAPLAPEPGPDPIQIGEREQAARSRGLLIRPKVDLSGLGNQKMGKPVQTIQIDSRDRMLLNGRRDVQGELASRTGRTRQ